MYVVGFNFFSKILLENNLSRRIQSFLISRNYCTLLRGWDGKRFKGTQHFIFHPPRDMTNVQLLFKQLLNVYVGPLPVLPALNGVFIGVIVA